MAWLDFKLCVTAKSKRLTLSEQTFVTFRFPNSGTRTAQEEASMNKRPFHFMLYTHTLSSSADNSIAANH